jgi:cysteine desulfuration protein SufE
VNIIQRQQMTVKEFAALATWEDKYKRIIELGKKLPEYPEEFKIEQFKVKGCQSQVWLKTQISDQGIITFTGDSDALLVRGLLAMILNVFSKATAREIIEAPLDFLQELGLESHLSPSRSNGVFAMIKQIRLYAQAFLIMEQAKK